MPRFLSRSVLGAIVVTVCAGAPAQAAAAAPTPGPVSVRVEGTSATLVPLTLVATQPGSYKPAGKPNACPGTSGAEALDLATLVENTTWGGTFDAGFGDYLVNSIGLELHPTSPTDGGYWAFWYDHKPATTGICNQPLNPNDEILFFPDCFAFGKTTCPAGFVSPNVLGMTAPTIAQKGAPVGVTVISYANGTGAQSPAAGATVAGGGATATTNGTGGATLTFPATGTFTVKATAPNSIRSEAHAICVHDGNDGNCGTTAPPGSPTPTGGSPSPSATTTVTPPCVHQGNDGRCGTPDQTPPKGHLTIAEGARFGHGRGPRTVTGRVDTDPSGIRDVRLRITRVVPHKRCEAYNAARRRFATARCGVANAPSFSVGSGLSFAYLLPAALAKGRYEVAVEAIDGAGNHDGPAPGRNRIVFRVA